MKAVLVIDVDDDMIGEVDYTVLNKKEMVNGRAELRPLPKPITEYEVKVSYDYDSDYAQGWNDFFDEIMGETE